MNNASVSTKPARRIQDMTVLNMVIPLVLGFLAELIVSYTLYMLFGLQKAEEMIMQSNWAASVTIGVMCMSLVLGALYYFGKFRTALMSEISPLVGAACIWIGYGFFIAFILLAAPYICG